MLVRVREDDVGGGYAEGVLYIEGVKTPRHLMGGICLDCPPMVNWIYSPRAARMSLLASSG